MLNNWQSAWSSISVTYLCCVSILVITFLSISYPMQTIKGCGSLHETWVIGDWQGKLYCSDMDDIGRTHNDIGRTHKSKRESNHRAVSGFSFAIDFCYMHLIFKGIFKMKVIFSVFLYFIKCLICPGEEIPYTVSRCRNLVKTALGQCYIILSIRI